MDSPEATLCPPKIKHSSYSAVQETQSGRSRLFSEPDLSEEVLTAPGTVYQAQCGDVTENLRRDVKEQSVERALATKPWQLWKSW